MSQKNHLQDSSYNDRLLKAIEESGGFEWTPGSKWPPELPDDVYSDKGLTYTLDDCYKAYKEEPCDDWNDLAGG